MASSSNTPILPASDPSITLMIASGVIGLLGAWAYLEYLRRVRHDGPVLARRELLFGAVAMGSALWASAVVALSAQGLPYTLGFHPGWLAAALALPVVATGLASYAVVALPRMLMHLLAGAWFCACALATELLVVQSVNPTPSVAWRREPLAFGAMMVAIAYVVALRMVIMQRRGSATDTRGRRFSAALLLAAALAANLELASVASNLGSKFAALYSKQLPEVAVALAAGAAVPLMLMLMLIDQRMQARIRASSRKRQAREVKKTHVAEQKARVRRRRSAEPAERPQA